MPNGGFNEATLFQAWKECEITMLHTWYIRFNEATLFQAWKGHKSKQWSRDHLCFNEATLFQAWKVALIFYRV